MGTEYLAGFSLGNLSGNVTGYAIIIGILSATDTLAPRAVGANRFAEVGYLATRGSVMCILFLFPMVFVWWNMEGTLVALGQVPATAKLAAEWLRVYMLSLPPLILFNVIQRVLNCQEIVLPLVGIAAFLAVFIHPLLLYFLVHSHGLVGSAIAFCITNVAQVSLAFLYMIKFKPHHPDTFRAETHLSWLTRANKVSFEATFNVNAMKEFLKLGAGGILTMSEWVFWEVVCFTAGRFGVIQLATHTVAYNLVPLCYMIPLGISIGVSVRIGHLLAEGNVARAKRMVYGTLVVSERSDCL